MRDKRLEIGFLIYNESTCLQNGWQVELIEEKYAWDRGTQRGGGEYEGHKSNQPAVSQLFVKQEHVWCESSIVGRMKDVSNVFEDELLE